jgi:hypothetical protein
VRPYAIVSIAVLLASCARHASSSSSPTPQPTPLPLRSCEVRTLTLDGAELVVQANADSTVASIVVVRAPDEQSRAQAYDDARHDFGEPNPDTRTRLQGIKDGLSQVTDYCGRPVLPSPSPSS